MKLSVLIVTCICLLSFLACHKKHDCEFEQTHVLLELLKNGVAVDSQTLKSVRCYCYKNGSKVYLPGPGMSYVSHNVDSTPYLVVNYWHPVFEMQAAWLSADGIKTFYLEYPNNDVDSIYIDFSKDGGCYSLIEIKYHGSVPSYDSVNFMSHFASLYPVYICDQL